MAYGTCTQCGCTDKDCRQCIEATGEPCFWVDDEHQICSRCYIEVCERDLNPEQMEKLRTQLEEIKSAQKRSFSFEFKMSAKDDKRFREFIKSLPVEPEEKIKGTWQQNGQDKK